jgi:hypothetical protein
MQAADSTLWINRRLTLVVDALCDPQLPLIDPAANTKPLMHVESILQAFKPYRTFSADVLGNFLVFILV